MLRVIAETTGGQDVTHSNILYNRRVVVSKTFILGPDPSRPPPTHIIPVDQSQAYNDCTLTLLTLDLYATEFTVRFRSQGDCQVASGLLLCAETNDGVKHLADGWWSALEAPLPERAMYAEYSFTPLFAPYVKTLRIFSHEAISVTPPYIRPVWWEFLVTIPPLHRG